MSSIRDKEIARDRLMANGANIHDASRDAGITNIDFWQHAKELRERAKKRRGRQAK